MVNKLYCHFSGSALSALLTTHLRAEQMGELSQWDFCGRRHPGIGRAGKAAILKVVLELVELRKRDQSTAGRSKVGF